MILLDDAGTKRLDILSFQTGAVRNFHIKERRHADSSHLRS